MQDTSEITECTEPKLPCCAQEQPEGKLAAAWAKAASGLPAVDVAVGMARLLAVKDAAEITHVKRAAYLAGRVIKDYLVAEVEGARTCFACVSRGGSEQSEFVQPAWTASTLSGWPSKLTVCQTHGLATEAQKPGLALPARPCLLLKADPQRTAPCSRPSRLCLCRRN